MLSIGEFSAICKVSAKTLRYYAEIGLIHPEEINPESGYRYYSIRQLETMLFINRLKSYSFSLDEIKSILHSEELTEEILYPALIRKEREMEKQILEYKKTLEQMNQDIANLKQGRSIMSYLDTIEIQLAELPQMYLLSVRKMLDDKLTAAAPPMVLFHSEEFTSLGLDTEFAIPVKEYATGTSDHNPGLCLKTVLHGSYSALPSVYAKQRKWAEKEGYEGNGALCEVYITDPSQVSSEDELITEIYYPVKKKTAKTQAASRSNAKENEI